MKQAFNIENYRFVKNNNILVYIERDKIAIPITIPKEQFEQWLLLAERRITSMVLHDAENQEQPVDCIMSLEEYWKLDDKEVHGDLYDYIITHPINFRGIIYERSLTSINWAFNRHKSERN